MKKSNTLSGFSLIEVSIALIVIGIISAINIPQLIMMMKIYSQQKTLSNIDFVMKSLGVYYSSADRMRLPFPSDMNKDIGLQNEKLKDSFGIIPFKTLGIMEQFAKDGNGRWLLYQMSHEKSKKSLGISDFDPKINDKVFVIIKSLNTEGNTDAIVWYSEKNFGANFALKRPPQIPCVNRPPNF
jgi:prepilin-type N-terminal cleavage/methylation domain-containing protein